ncbi:MAG: Holliday junction resolvase RuvX [Pseudomonadota bacterium]|nr:Holliday junction resolvase RuvX [Pseudomonadota bacterium]
MMRVLGIDYGTRRIGVALSDEMGLMARGLTVITRRNRRRDIEAIAALARDCQAEMVVIGYPLRLDGSEGIQCEKVNRFASLLENALQMPVIRWDETLSTKEAEQILVETGIKKEKRKAIVDRIAASIILQNYLDSVRPRTHQDSPSSGDSF